MVEAVKVHRIGLPRRQFVSGDVHYAGPFARHGIPLTLCGSTGMLKPGRVRAPISCGVCDQLARFVWSHSRPAGFGEKARRAARS